MRDWGSLLHPDRWPEQRIEPLDGEDGQFVWSFVINGDVVEEGHANSRAEACMLACAAYRRWKRRHGIIEGGGQDATN